jgi:hypothetical protein
MIGLLDTFRADLEDLGSGMGVTDPVSGEVVLSIQSTDHVHPTERSKS